MYKNKHESAKNSGESRRKRACRFEATLRAFIDIDLRPFMVQWRRP